MKRFLNSEMEYHRNLSLEALQQMRQVFEDAIAVAYVVFEENAFRRFLSRGMPITPTGPGKAVGLMWPCGIPCFTPLPSLIRMLC